MKSALFLNGRIISMILQSNTIEIIRKQRKLAGITPEPENLNTKQACKYAPVLQNISSIKNHHQSATTFNSLIGERQSSLRATTYRQGRLYHYEPLGWRTPLVCVSQFNNGILEGFNSLIQYSKPKSAGLTYPQNLYQHGISNPVQAGSQAAYLNCRGIIL